MNFRRYIAIVCSILGFLGSFGQAHAALSVEQYALCPGESLILSASSDIRATAFSWFRNGVPVGEDASILTVSEAGIYRVLAVNERECGSELSDPVEVLISPVPVLRINNPAAVCVPGASIDLRAEIADFDEDRYDYRVTTPGGQVLRMEDLTDIRVTSEYIVSVAFKGEPCYSSITRVQVRISDEQINAGFIANVDGMMVDEDVINDAFPGGPIQFSDQTIGRPITWNWDFGDGTTSTEASPVHAYESVGSYTVRLRVTNEIGCISEIIKVVNVYADYKIIFPNAFTPRGPINAYFKPEFRGIVEMELNIFNTWGELIYQTFNREDKGWDGTLNGVEAPNGNYVYRAKFVSRSGETIERAGVFILLK
jgi:large repetitive protein